MSQLANALERMQTDDGYFTYGAVVWDALTLATAKSLSSFFSGAGLGWKHNLQKHARRSDRTWPRHPVLLHGRARIHGGNVSCYWSTSKVEASHYRRNPELQ